MNIKVTFEMPDKNITPGYYPNEKTAYENITLKAKHGWKVVEIVRINAQYQTMDCSHS